MKKSILLSAVTAFLAFNFSYASAQSSCCSKNPKKYSCEKTYCDKAKSDKTSMNLTKGKKEISFKVSGNCEMCEARIEKAALGVPGVKTAEWNKTSKLLKVTFNGDVKKKDIEKAIAAAGHDTPDFKADSKSYNALPGCCKYER